VSQPQSAVNKTWTASALQSTKHYSPPLPSIQIRTPDVVDSLFLKINHENKIPETKVTELKPQ
jgi:UV DNA damage repair endonuclease